MDGQLNLFGNQEIDNKVKKLKPKPKKEKVVDPTQTYDERMKRFWHFFNHKTCYENQIETCVGELRIIVDALADYSDYVQKNVDEMAIGYNKAVWEIRLDKIKDIQSKLEESIGYNRDEQLIKCQKKKGNSKDDIGEDALVLALK